MRPLTRKLYFSTVLSASALAYSGCGAPKAGESCTSDYCDSSTMLQCQTGSTGAKTFVAASSDRCTCTSDTQGKKTVACAATMGFVGISKVGIGVIRAANLRDLVVARSTVS